jgi:hypothetical protein
MNKRLKKDSIIIVIFSIIIFVLCVRAVSAGYQCTYDYCDEADFCSMNRCKSEIDRVCDAGEFWGGEYGYGEGTTCCLNQCCSSGYYDCCSTTYGCCCPISSPPCIPEDSCDCGNYATEDQDYGSITVTCPDGCGGTASSTCYCYQCTPDPCPSNTYTTDQGNESISTTCENDCEVSNSRTCYCPAADCADYDDGSGINWVNDPPEGEYSREAELKVPIANALVGCPNDQTRTCYVPYSENAPPTNTSIEVIPAGNVNSALSYSTSNIFSKLVNQIKAAEFSDDKILGYSSNDHSGIGLELQQGGGLNNPVGITATYSDPDGQEDIQALYIWWNPSTAKSFPTPNQVLTGQPQTDSNQNFGFLISRNGIGGAWDSIYVPRTSGTDRVWIKKGGINDQIAIAGPSPEDMVVLDNIGVTQSGNNEVQLQLTMQFKTDTDDIVKTSLYNLWGMANDYIGFTEFEESGMIKDSENWEISGETWTLDMVQPVIEESSLYVEDTAKSQVTVNININDEDELSYIRLDACKSGIDNPSPLSSEYIDNYDLQTCDTFSEEKENIDVTVLDSLLGTEGKRYDNNQSSYTSDVDIYLGENKEGAITFHLTVLDKAGNVKQDTEIYKLEQWATAKDGFVFGLNGVTSSTRGVDVSEWDGHPVLEGFRNSYVNEVDLTNQVLLGADELSNIFLRELIHTSSNHSFSAANYPGIFLGLPYQELKMAYKNKAGKEDNIDLVSIGNTLTGGLPADCTTQYCILEGSEDLLIDEFVCDGKALIAVDGNVTIEPNLTNDTNQDACIILASGDIQIGYGDRVTTGDTPGYDIVEAFLIAGGKIDIPKQAEFDPPNDDGLYIEGGLVSFTPPPESENRSSVYNQREIHFSNMGVYPVLVVDNNAKYGLLSKTVFGSQIDIFKIEVGFKPY